MWILGHMLPTANGFEIKKKCCQQENSRVLRAIHLTVHHKLLVLNLPVKLHVLLSFIKAILPHLTKLLDSFGSRMYLMYHLGY